MFGEDKIGPASVADLVRDDGLVHSSVYTDQKIFDLEMERIFHRTWLYVGHVTEVPNQGDYRRKTMGRHPVILVRGDDDKVRVLMNRCRHRGAMGLRYHWQADRHALRKRLQGPGGYRDPGP